MKSLNISKRWSVFLSYNKGIGQCVVITKASSLWTTYNILSNTLLSSLIPHTDETTADHLCW